MDPAVTAARAIAPHRATGGYAVRPTIDRTLGAAARRGEESRVHFGERTVQEVGLSGDASLSLHEASDRAREPAMRGVGGGAGVRRNDLVVKDSDVT